jgi:hypothetical protein
LYRAGDCFLQNSDVGLGASDARAGSVACTTGAEPGSRVEQWAPLTPGSHYYESYFNVVWARIGQQLPFPDTSDDAVRQDNGAGLSWTATVGAGSVASFSHLTAFSPTGATEVSDTDGDGFPDSWEESTGGVDTDGDGTPDLKLSDYGATPDRPDVFVQVNWTQTRSCRLIFFCSTTNRRPSLAALRDVQRAYATHGVRLHVDAGPDSTMNPDDNTTWGARSQVHNGLSAPARIAGVYADDTAFDWSVAYDGLRRQAISAQRARIFHLAIYVGTIDDSTNSGWSRNGGPGFAGRDLILAHDDFPGGRPTRMQEAGTFMHELGHNMGLSHGGSSTEQNLNWKPNYPSVMNYFWQFSGTFKNRTQGLLDYSEGTLAPVDENAMNEADGLGPDPAAQDVETMWGCPDGRKSGPVPSVRSVDWNCDGSIATGTERANVTGVGPAGRRDTDITSRLSDHDDWASLVYDGGGTLGGAGDPGSAPSTTSRGEEPSAAELEAVAPDLHAVSLTSPGQLVVRTGTSAPVSVAVANHRDVAVTYQLTQVADGVTLSGLPDHVTLAAGGSVTLPGVLAAGAVSDSAFFEVDAQVSGDPSNTGSTVTEVYVVGQDVPDQPPVIGAAAQVTPAGGDGQTALVGQPFGTPLDAVVSDASGNPVPGASVTFTISAGATFANGTRTATVVTGPTGHAVAPAMRAGAVAGAFTVSATVPGVPGATFAETVTTANPTGRADLAVSSGAVPVVTRGQPFATRAVVRNLGPTTATGVLVAVPTPYGVEVVDAGGGQRVPGAVLFRTSSLRAGATATFTVTMRLVRPQTSAFVLSAYALAATPDPALRNNSSRTTVRVG